MPSRPSSVRPSSTFSNGIGSLSFHPIVPIFGVNMQSNISHKVVEVEF